MYDPSLNGSGTFFTFAKDVRMGNDFLKSCYCFVEKYTLEPAPMSLEKEPMVRQASVLSFAVKENRLTEPQLEHILTSSRIVPRNP